MNIVKSSITVVKHPIKKNNYAVRYFTPYGKAFYLMGVNSSTSKWYRHTKSNAYALAKRVRRKKY